MSVKVIDDQKVENKTSREINVSAQVNKTWEEMNFSERKALVEENYRDAKEAHIDLQVKQKKGPLVNL